MSNAPNLSRRAVLAGGGLAASASLAAPAIAQGAVRWRMVTSWPENLPGPGVTAQRLTDRVRALSDGRFEIELYPAGSLVPALEVFDAVRDGVAEAAHTASFFWQGKIRASVFFTAMPFGLTTPEHQAWIVQGGGQEIWDELYAPFGLKPFMAGNTGMQMGGWYKFALTGADDLKGLKIRMPGIGGEIVRRLGAVPTSLPPGEIFSALESGLIDAAEFLGPWSDQAQGFWQVAPVYHWPGFHEPNGTGELIVARDALDALPGDLRVILNHAAAAENAFAVAESDWFNAVSLRQLVDEHQVKLAPFPRDVLTLARAATPDVLDEIAAEDTGFARALASYRAAINVLRPWSDVGVKGYLAARAG
ncbi:MAG: TRAP transporter substrate-binding protein [Pseudomonadota bacterium]